MLNSESEVIVVDHTRRTEWLCSIAIVASAVLYRPLTFWADNAWDLLSPLEIFTPVALEFVLGMVVLFLLAALPGVRPLLVALAVGWVILIVFNWGELSLVGFLTLSGVTLAVFSAFTFDRLSPSRATVVILAFGLLAPLVTLVNAHVSNNTSYPLDSPAALPLAETSDGSGDILLLVLDEYPMAEVAEAWFGHDMSPLLALLRDEGFETPRVSWSHNTYTSVAVPAMLDLIQVVDPTSVGDWDHLKKNYETIRGANFTVQALKSAGFRQIHVESGWNGDDCGAPDECLRTSWLDEATWLLLEPSLFHPLIEDRFGSWIAWTSMTTVENLLETDAFRNNTRDFVYAHLLLPHTPEVVDEECKVLDPRDRLPQHDGISPQLTCVDALVAQVLETIPADTTVVITGDHGTATRGQHHRNPSDWDDDDIAERLGTFLAYRLPDGCPEPNLPTNVSVMRSVVGCATGTVLPAEARGFVLGLKNPTEVPIERLVAIEAKLRDGGLVDP